MDVVPPVALCPPLSLATAQRLPADAGSDRGDAGAALPDHAADGQRADPVPERQADRLAAGQPLSQRPAWFRAARLAAWLDTYLYPGADVGAYRARPADNDLRAPARPVAGVFRRQTDRRPDGAHRQRNRPHQRLPVARPAQLRHRRADDRDDGSHSVLDQPVAGAGHPAAAADHRLDDPFRAREAAHRLREDRPCLGRGDQRAGRHHSRHPRRQGLRPGKARGRALPGRQRAQSGDERQAEQDLVAVFADGHAAHRNRPAGRLGLRHLADLQERDHGWRADRLPRLHRSLLHPSRFDEPYRLRHPARRLQHQAHFRHPRPRLQRAGTGQPGAPDQGHRPHRTQEGQLPLRHPRRDARCRSGDQARRNDRPGRA